MGFVPQSHSRGGYIPLEDWRNDGHEGYPASLTGETDVDSLAHSTRAAKSRNESLGKPRAKQVLDWMDLASIVISFACLVAAILTVTRHTNLAWQLGLYYQIIVVGFLLSVMNLCLRRVAPHVCMMLEARYGRSEVQNYDAIARNTMFATSTRWLWRIVILALTGLPIGLSVGYKQFTGGTATNTLPSMSGRYYQMTGPPGINDIGTGAGIALAMNATVPLLSASATSEQAPLDELPRAYGFNNLLLSNTSSAFLDIPTVTNLTVLQDYVKDDERLTISARVNATVATYNNEIDQHRWDPSWWARHQGDHRKTHPLYNGYSVVYMAPEYGWADVSWAIVGFIGDYDTDVFNRTALLYKIQRQKCNGTWDITKTSIALKHGFCDDDVAKVNQTIYTHALLIAGSFFMNFVQQATNSFAPGMRLENSTWSTPVWTTVVAAILWARPQFRKYQPWWDYTTFLIDDEVTLTKPVMSDTWGLYLILVAQPVITLGFLLCGIFYYSIPIGKGFGMLSILAGADTDSLKILQGAGLSGKTEAPIRMDIRITNSGVHGGNNPELERVTYRFGLGASNSTKRQSGSIRRGQVYG